MECWTTEYVDCDCPVVILFWIWGGSNTNHDYPTNLWESPIDSMTMPQLTYGNIILQSTLKLGVRHMQNLSVGIVTQQLWRHI